MNGKMETVFAGLMGLATLALSGVPALAQMQEVKSKPPMYSYVANWQVPRANWGDMEKTTGSVNGILDQAFADGTIIGHGYDVNLVHTETDSTHDVWWSSMSMAGIIKALDRIHASSVYTNSAPSLNESKHWDEVWVSHYYNWKSGAFKNAYTHVGVYKLKDDAPDSALDDLSQHFMVPVLEKLIADGTILEYEIDEAAIHTAAPGTFLVVYLTPTPEGIDTTQQAVRDAVKAHPLSLQAFGSVTEDSGHRDGLAKSDGVYK
jgi:hypothetical protein